MNQSSIFNFIIILVILYFIISTSFQSLEHALDNQKSNYAKPIVCISFLFMVLVVNIVSNKLKFKVNSNKNQISQLFKSINNNYSINRCDISCNSSNSINNNSNNNNTNNYIISSFTTVNNQNNLKLINKFNQDIRSNLLAIPTVDVNELVFTDNNLGKGDYGSVKKARFMGKEVAVKTGYKFNKLTINEMKCHILLSGHKNIIDIEGCYNFEISKMPSLILELMDKNLIDYLLANKCSISGQSHSIFRITNEIIDGLKYMHYNNFVHGDLHPGNILVKSNPGEFCPSHVKISDFGLCKYLPSDPLSDESTVGCGLFMSPESISGGRAVFDKSDDIYSLAVIVLLMFNLVTYGSRCDAIINRFLAIGVSGLDINAMPGLEGIIRKSLGPKSMRPTIDEFEQEINREATSFNEMNNWILKISKNSI